MDFPSDLHARVPINKTTARVTQTGVGFVSDRQPGSLSYDVPPPTRRPSADCDLTGHTTGRLTVVGLAAQVTNRWVCRCICGHYVLRSARALRNPKNDRDGCYECQYTDHLKRVSTYLATGEYPEGS